MTVPEILRRIMQEKSNAILVGAPKQFIHGLEVAMAIIRLAAREENK
jgi:hypothetical protein